MQEDLARYLKANAARFSDYTLQTYGHMLGRLTDWLALTGVDASALDGELLRHFLDEQDWGANSRRLCIYAARSFCRWRYGSEHPLLHFTEPRPKPTPQRTFDFEEAAKVLMAVDTSTAIGRRDLALLALALDSGLRAFELAGVLTKNLHITDESNWATVLSKGRKWAAVAFSPYTASCLLAWLGDRPQVLEHHSRTDPGTVFLSLGGVRPGTSITYQAVKLIFRKYTARAGVAHAAPHVSRRTAATLALLSGAPSRVVQEQMRLESFDLLRTYTQMLPVQAFMDYSPVEGILGIRRRRK